ILPLDPLGGFGDPARDGVRSELAARAGGGPPESGKGKLAQIVLDFEANVERMGVDVENLPPVRRVDGAGGDGEIGGGVHVVPPKKLGAGEGGIPGPEAVPDLR